MDILLLGCLACACALGMSTAFYDRPKPPSLAELGKSSWTWLHSTVAKFPDQPGRSDQRDMRELLYSFAKYFPCQRCSREFMKEMHNLPPDTTSRKALVQWACDIHNRINSRLKKGLFDCSKVDERWGKPDVQSCGAEMCSI